MSQILKNKVVRFVLGLPYLYPEDSNHKTIAVLIPAYNEEKTIGDTIRSLKNQTRLPDEILVIDDYSQDKTGEIARNLGAKVIRLEKNSGTKSQAQNAGLPHIVSNITITIDADTILDSKAIANIVKPLSDPNVASVCGLVIPQRIQTLWEKSRFIEYLCGIPVAKGAQAHIGTVLVSSGCFSAFRTKELQKKGFKKRSMAEDMDLTWEFLIEGRRIAYVGNAICFPLDPSTYKIYQAQVGRWYRSFFQNISIHRKKLLKRKRLVVFVSWYLVEGLLNPLLLLILPFFIITKNWVMSPLIALHFILLAVISIWVANRIKSRLLAFKSLPSYFLVSLVNMYLFWRSFFQEWVLRNKLTYWEKGH